MSMPRFQLHFFIHSWFHHTFYRLSAKPACPTAKQSTSESDTLTRFKLEPEHWSSTPSGPLPKKEFFLTFLSRGHATVHLAVSVGRLVCRSIPNIFELRFSRFFRFCGFCITAPAQPFAARLRECQLKAIFSVFLHGGPRSLKTFSE